MKECAETRERLEVFWDSENAGDLPQEIRFHLSQCPECRDYWERLQSLETAIHQAAQAPIISPQTHQRIMQSIQRDASLVRPQTRRREWFGIHTKWLAAAAILILALGISHLAFNLREAAQKEPEQARVLSSHKDSTSPLEPADLAAILKPPDVIASAREDFSWLAQAIISQPQSALRAFSIQTASVNITPVPTPDS